VLSAPGLPHEATSGKVLLDDDPEWRARLLLEEEAVAPPTTAIASTVVLARFHTPVNAAEPSPDGNWVAVLTDTLTVALLPEALDYHAAAARLLVVDTRVQRCVAMSGTTSPVTCLMAGLDLVIRIHLALRGPVRCHGQGAKVTNIQIT
jgi:hypothetical protein